MKNALSKKNNEVLQTFFAEIFEKRLKTPQLLLGVFVCKASTLPAGECEKRATKWYDARTL